MSHALGLLVCTCNEPRPWLGMSPALGFASMYARVTSQIFRSGHLFRSGHFTLE